MKRFSRRMPAVREWLVLVTASTLAGCAGVPGQGIIVRELRCEYTVNPEGIDETSPRLTWIMDSAERGQRQTAYRVLVASSPQLLAADTGDLWDSGRVASDRSHLVEYAGKPLESYARCHWKVRAWDRDGRPSPWSRPATWSMGLLNPEDWKGVWIGLDEPERAVSEESRMLLEELKHCRWIWSPDADGASAAPAGDRFFRREVVVPPGTKVRRALIVIAGDNTSHILLNGKSVGLWSNFNQATQIDVTSAILEGVNHLAVHVNNAGQEPNPAGLIGFLRIDPESGEPIVVRTDGAFKVLEKAVDAWEQPATDTSDWPAARELGEYGMAPWGQVTLAPSEDRALPARHLRKEFDVPVPVRRATAVICGLGYYELYLNGRKVGDHVLDPNYTHYSRRAFYVTYDVTGQLRTGRNAVGVWLGNSRYYAPRSSVPTGTTDYGFPKVRMQIRIDHTDGTSSMLVSDESWKLTTDGPIRENNDYDGEVYDARMELDGWSEPGYDDSAWQPARLVDPPGGELRAQMAPPIRVTETLKPVTMTEPEPGTYIYDLGQNIVGWARLTVSGPAGTRVQLRFAEALDDKGRLYTANLRSARCTDVYILKGKGVEVYEPRFTYHGFQYIELTGYPGRPTLETVEARAVHSDVESMGSFACSNPLINRIFRNVTWGIRGNLRSIPTDCPQRDERQGWLGDIANQSRAESYEFNMATFFTKWLTDIRDAQEDSGSIPDVAPPFWRIYSDNVTWPASFVIIPGWFLDHYGDTRLVAANYPAICRWLEHMKGYMKDDLMPRDQYGDWCVPPESPELIHSRDQARRTDGELLGSAYFYHCLRLAARFAEVLGKPDEAEAHKALAERVRTAFNRKFLDAAAGRYSNGTQTSCVLPLYFGLVPDEHRQAVFNTLVRSIMEDNRGHLATGLIGGQWLMRTLTAGGRPDVAFTIATQTAYPSWGYMVDKGATTIWELWNGDTADPAMNSRNHLMLVGDLTLWLWESVAGIRPDRAAPGFKHIIMRPLPVGDLTFAAGTHRSMYGEIRSRWRREGGAFDWDVQVPVNTTATLHVPTTAPDRVSESGRPAVQAPGVRFVRTEPGAAVYEVGSGTYRFSAPLK